MLTTETGERMYVGESNPSSSADDDPIDEARDSLAAHAPSTFGGIPQQDVEVKEIEGNGGLWLGVVRYGLQEFGGNAQEAGDDAEYEFDISASTSHITTSIATDGGYAAGGSSGGVVPTFGGLIGVTKDGVEGVDIYTPVSSFGFTRTFAAEDVTLEYVDTIESLVGTFNNADFDGRPAGEVLFIGCTGRQRANGDWVLTFRFARSKNKSNFVVNPSADVADQITVSSKRGWDYLWVFYEDVVDADVDRIVKRAVAAYVEQVYEAGDLSLLNLGV